MVGGFEEGGREDFWCPPLSSARRAFTAHPGYRSTVARDGLLAGDRYAGDSRVQRLQRRTDSAGRVPGRRVVGYSLACNGLSQRLQNDRPREHQRGDSDTRGGDWKESRTPLRLCREPAGPGGRSGKHSLPQLQDSVDRALWLSDSRLPPDAERVLPIMRQQHPREMGACVSGSDHRAPLCAAHAHPIRFACAELLTSHAISWLSGEDTCGALSARNVLDNVACQLLQFIHSCPCSRR